jgi:hypothetical protein
MPKVPSWVSTGLGLELRCPDKRRALKIHQRKRPDLVYEPDAMGTPSDCNEIQKDWIHLPPSPPILVTVFQIVIETQLAQLLFPCAERRFHGFSARKASTKGNTA